MNTSSLNPNSRLWHQRAENILVGGGQAHRRTGKYTLRGAPEFATRAKGAYFWDVDDRKYLDYLMSYGPILLGHADERVNQAVSDQMALGTIFSVEHPHVIELAERLTGIISCAERVTFLVGGSSATTAAVRCARAHNGKAHIVRCGYHGWFDWCVPDDIGAPAHMRDLVHAVPYNDLEKLEEAFETYQNNIACFILEGWQDDGPLPGYMQGVRDLCDQHGIVFILDEVKTGFRFGLGGAQAYMGAEPDLSTFGKAMCNGFPASVLVGRADILAARNDTFIGATFHGGLASVAAANVVIDVLEQTDGLSRIHRLGKRLIDGINQTFTDADFPLRMGGHPVMPQLYANKPDDPIRPPQEWEQGKVLTEYCAAMQRRSLFVTGHVWFVSLAHTPEDIEYSIASSKDAIEEAKELLIAIAKGEQEALSYV